MNRATHQSCSESFDYTDVGQKFTCERWADHPGPHAIGEHAAILDYDDALRMRLVLATERQAKALEAIAAILDDVCNGDGYVRTVVVE